MRLYNEHEGTLLSRLLIIFTTPRSFQSPFKLHLISSPLEKPPLFQSDPILTHPLIHLHFILDPFRQQDGLSEPHASVGRGIVLDNFDHGSPSPSRYGSLTPLFRLILIIPSFLILFSLFIFLSNPLPLLPRPLPPNPRF